jgi:3-hydroxyisobutyrate dehydrogenase-like beta-hydroxyacid dehydrogenase
MAFVPIFKDKILTETFNAITSSSTIIDKKTFVNRSTVHPETTASISDILSGLDAVFLAAPVFGGPAVAQSGQLVFAFGGPSQNQNQLDIRRYIVGVMGKKVIECGTEARSVSLLKIGG